MFLCKFVVFLASTFTYLTAYSYGYSIHDHIKSNKFKGSVKYKLDPAWPKDPSIFTGQVYCVGVDDKNDDIYVGQVG